MKALASTTKSLGRLTLRPTNHQACLLSSRPNAQQRRHVSFDPSGKPAPVTNNPILERYLKTKPKPQQPSQGDLVMGKAASDSIFADQEASEEVRLRRQQREAKDKKATVQGIFGDGVERNLDAMALVLDPDPANRRRWERNMVIQQIRKRGRLTKAQVIKRTEREHLSKSHFIKTSYKKLGMLARQIAGKTLDEAIVQMRFSKKKAAKEVRAQLEMARDEAIVTRGMGLGSVSIAADGADNDASAASQAPIDIQLKDGKRKTITDRTRIYVDQAWVGKGPIEKEQEFRARGRVNILQKPHTSISVLLKEEATRVRLYQEKQKKLDNRKLWTQLPDRPISEQRQYPLW